VDLFALTPDTRAYFAGAAVAAAHELGLFAALATGARSADELAGALGVGARRLGRLLDVLALDGVLERDDAAGGPRFARTGAPPPAPCALPGGWGGLAEAIRRDRPRAGVFADAA
jgi:hypothetical protein